MDCCTEGSKAEGGKIMVFVIAGTMAIKILMRFPEGLQACRMRGTDILAMEIGSQSGPWLTGTLPRTLGRNKGRKALEKRETREHNLAWRD
jgi:hypothetical protein